MPGVGQQRQRIGQDAVSRLDDDKAGIEKNADCKRLAEVLRRMRMTVIVRMIMVVRVFEVAMIGHGDLPQYLPSKMKAPPRHGTIPLGITQRFRIHVLDRLAGRIDPGVVHQDGRHARLALHILDQLRHLLQFAHVQLVDGGIAPGRFDSLRGAFGALPVMQSGNDDIGTFLSEGDRCHQANTRIGNSNERQFTLQSLPAHD